MHTKIPFGNSQFQILNFIAQEETPQRACRTILLQLNEKENTMKECAFRRRRKEIDIEELKEKLKTAQGFEAKRLQVDLEEIEWSLGREIKLIEDCAVEIATYRKLLEQFPEFTREEFEESELHYWQKKLIAQSEREYFATGSISTGVIEALGKIGISMRKNQQGQIEITGNLPKGLTPLEENKDADSSKN